MASLLPSAAAIRASSVDTEQRIPYNRHRTYPKKPETMTAPLASVSSRSLGKSPTKLTISELLRRDISENTHVELNGLYLGYETWLPTPPKVERPKSVLNPASLAYIGDCVYEAVFVSSLSLDEYNDRVMAVEAMLQNLISENFLSQEERDLLRWGKNSGSAKTRSKKRAGAAVYSRATSLETLVGYLYLTDKRRLDEIMQKIGFSTDMSSTPTPSTVGLGNTET